MRGAKIEMMRGIRGFVVNGVTHSEPNAFVDDAINVKFYRIGYMWQAVHLQDFDVYVFWDYGEGQE